MSSEEEVVIRDGRPEDVPHILAMIQELATYEGFPEGPKLTEEILVQDGFGPSPWYFLLVAEAGGRLVGYALCNRAYSSWTGRALYLEDLFVEPTRRRRGVGRRLLRSLARLAVRLGVARLDWHVAEDNEPARAFYEQLGARDLRASEGRAALRLDDEFIRRLADE